MPLIDLVGRSLVLVTIPTEVCLISVVLILTIGNLFVETFVLVPLTAVVLDRDKGAAS